MKNESATVAATVAIVATDAVSFFEKWVKKDPIYKKLGPYE